MSSLGDLYTHLKTLCEQWFYNKSTVDTYLGNKVDKETGKGLSTNDYTTAEKSKLSGIEAEANKTTVDSALSSTSTNPLQNKAINTALSGKASSSHTHSSADVTEASALSHIGTSANATQHDVNSAIDSIIGNLTSAELINVVTTLPTASASTQNALYLLSDDGQYDIYITTESSGSYSWEKLDDDVLSDLSIDWSDIENKPSTFTPSSHTHGYINNDGTIDVNSASFSTLNYPLVRDNSDGKLKTGLLSTYSVKDSKAYSNIGSSANADQTTINGKINTAIGNINTSLSGKASSSHTHSSADVTEASALSHIGTSASATQHIVNTAIDTAIGELWDDVEGKRNVQRAYCEVPNDVVEEGHYYKLGGIVYDMQNQGMSFLDVMVDDYDRIVQVCYEYDYGEAPDNDVHQYIRYSTNNGSTWSSWKRFVEESEFTTALNGKASSSHNHGNILNGGTITQTGTNGGNLVVTNSNNAVVVESVIDVMDGLVQNLISYGGS